MSHIKTRQHSAMEEDLVSSVLEQVLRSQEFQDLLKSSVEKALSKVLVPLRENIEENKGRIHELECQVESLAKETTKLDKLCDEMQRQNIDLVKKLDDAEQYSRRNCLRISGVPETEGENTDELVLDIASSRLRVNISLSDIDRSHRTGKPDINKTRSIIVKFTSYRARNTFIRDRRKLKGSGIVVREDLTKLNQDLLAKTKSHQLVKSAWTTDGRITALILKNGAEFRKKVRSINDLNTL